MRGICLQKVSIVVFINTIFRFIRAKFSAKVVKTMRVNNNNCSCWSNLEFGTFQGNFCTLYCRLLPSLISVTLQVNNPPRAPHPLFRKFNIIQKFLVECFSILGCLNSGLQEMFRWASSTFKSELSGVRAYVRTCWDTCGG